MDRIYIVRAACGAPYNNESHLPTAASSPTSHAGRTRELYIERRYNTSGFTASGTRAASTDGLFLPSLLKAGLKQPAIEFRSDRTTSGAFQDQETSTYSVYAADNGEHCSVGRCSYRNRTILRKMFSSGPCISQITASLQSLVACPP